MKSLLTAIVPVKNTASAEKDISDLSGQADVIELRLDYLELPTLDKLLAITNKIDLPYIITLRNQSQGGFFRGTEISRFEYIKNLLLAKPDYIDIESDTPHEWVDVIHNISPQTKIIRSYHDFKKTPEDLPEILKAMFHPKVSIYKIVTYANSSLDSLRMLHFLKTYSKKHHMVCHCMGESGYFSRIAGATLGNYFIYASLDNKLRVINHLITLNEFNSIYRIKQKDTKTKWYALIGDPIDHSLGHIFHNNNFTACQVNALYLKIKLQKYQLTEFFELIRNLPFHGFSVTMPLKMAVIPYIKNKSGLDAVNTLFVDNHVISGINTDGIGALDAIEQVIKVNNQHVLILGAGGAAIAIIKTAHERGAKIDVANRTLTNIKPLEQQYSIGTISFDETCNVNYDLIINTLPPTAFENDSLIKWLDAILEKHPVTMDVNYNRNKNVFLDLCKQHQCQYIPGDEMFINQAFAQFYYWNQVNKSIDIT